MKDLTPFPNTDLMLIKWEILLIIISILLTTGIYLGSNYLNQQSIQDLTAARSELAQAQSRVELIGVEEATIIEYIGRYQEIAQDGVVNPEDRLQLLETIAEIRSANSLFPIAFSIGKQNTLRLQYDSSVREPGNPIDLNYSEIKLSLPLLHEHDLSRLLRAINDSPGLYQTKECELILNNSSASNFYVLGQHINASCSLIWYTFSINSTNELSGFL